MRSIPDVCATINAAIASYFAAALSLDAARLLTLPLSGAEGLGSGLIFGVGRLVGPAAPGLAWLACVVAFELVAAGVVVVYLLNRLSGSAPSKATTAILRAALFLVAMLSIAAAVPALMAGHPGPIRLIAMHLALAGGAIVLDLVERRTTMGGTAANLPGGARPAAPRAAARWHDPSVDGWFSA